MKATLTFDLTDIDDEYKHKHALRGVDYFLALREIDEKLRTEIKYNNKNRLQEARDILHMILEDSDIDIS